MKLQARFAALLFALIGMNACSPIDQANTHLASMDSSTKTLSQSVSDDQAYLRSFSEQMELMQKHTEKLEHELEADREYIKSVADCMKSLADSLNALQKLGDSAVHAVLEALLKGPTADPKTPDAQDLLPPVAPAPVTPAAVS